MLAHWLALNARSFLIAAASDKLQLLLEYCLGDVLDDDAESVLQLVGLPLLPLGDGSVGTIQAAAPGGKHGKAEQGSGAALQCRLVMVAGIRLFELQQHAALLWQCLGNANLWPSTRRYDQTKKLLLRSLLPAGTYYTASEEDIRLFPTQSHQLIAMPARSALAGRLATIAGTGKLNVKRLGAGDLAAALLLQALPPGWR